MKHWIISCAALCKNWFESKESERKRKTMSKPTTSELIERLKFVRSQVGFHDVFDGTIDHLQSQQGEIERLKEIGNKKTELYYEAEESVDKLLNENQTLKDTLREVMEEVKGERYTDEHQCLPEAYRHRCEHCNHNKWVDSVVTLINKQLEE